MDSLLAAGEADPGCWGQQWRLLTANYWCSRAFSPESICRLCRQAAGNWKSGKVSLHVGTCKFQSNYAQLEYATLSDCTAALISICVCKVGRYPVAVCADAAVPVRCLRQPSVGACGPLLLHQSALLADTCSGSYHSAANTAQHRNKLSATILISMTQSTPLSS